MRAAHPLRIRTTTATDVVAKSGICLAERGGMSVLRTILATTVFASFAACAERTAPTESAPSTAPTPATPLDSVEKVALHDALDDEYRAWSTYDQVIRDLGEERPFTRIRAAEERHIAALKTTFGRYGLEVFPNPYVGRVPHFATFGEACDAGVAAEIANAALYERLEKSTQRSDILFVFDNLRRASEDRHLPAFRRCGNR